MQAQWSQQAPPPSPRPLWSQQAHPPPPSPPSLSSVTLCPLRVPNMLVLSIVFSILSITWSSRHSTAFDTFCPLAALVSKYASLKHGGTFYLTFYISTPLTGPHPTPLSLPLPAPPHPSPPLPAPPRPSPPLPAPPCPTLPLCPSLPHPTPPCPSLLLPAPLHPMPSYPYLSAISCTLSSSITLWSSRSDLLPHNTMSGLEQYACVCSCTSQLRMFKNDCSFVRSKSKRKPIASRKKAVVKLRNLQQSEIREKALVKSLW